MLVEEMGKKSDRHKASYILVFIITIIVCFVFAVQMFDSKEIQYVKDNYCLFGSDLKQTMNYTGSIYSSFDVFQLNGKLNGRKFTAQCVKDGKIRLNSYNSFCKGYWGFRTIRTNLIFPDKVYEINETKQVIIQTKIKDMVCITLPYDKV